MRHDVLTWYASAFVAVCAHAFVPLSGSAQLTGCFVLSLSLRCGPCFRTRHVPVCSGNLVAGVEIDDMGTKTVGNDLDNAWIHFDKVELPYSAMLNRFAGIDVEGDGAWTAGAGRS